MATSVAADAGMQVNRQRSAATVLSIDGLRVRLAAERCAQGTEGPRLQPAGHKHVTGALDLLRMLCSTPIDQNGETRAAVSGDDARRTHRGSGIDHRAEPS